MRLAFNGTSIPWPDACACCGDRPHEYVTVQETRTVFLVFVTFKRYFTLQVPYCVPCAEKIRERTHFPLGGAILCFVGTFLGLGYAVSLFSLNLSAAQIVFLLPLVLLAVSTIATVTYVGRYRKRELAPLIGTHFCDAGHAVRVEDFGRKRVVLTVHNEEFASKLLALGWEASS